MAGDSLPVKTHLIKVWEQTGKKPKELEFPDCPEELQYLKNWFFELYRGSKDITFSEIESWARLTATPIDPWEVNLLVELGQMLNKVVYGRNSQTGSSG